MNSPLIVWHPDGSAADVTFPYSAYVVAELKRAVPAPLRTYDPDLKTWTVAGRYVSAVYHVLAQVFGEVDVEGSRSGAADRGRPTGGDPYVVLHLLPTAPPTSASPSFTIPTPAEAPRSCSESIVPSNPSGRRADDHERHARPRRPTRYGLDRVRARSRSG